MLKIYSAEFGRYLHTIDIKGVLMPALKNPEFTAFCAFLGFLASLLGITTAFVLSITILFLMTILDFFVKRTIVGRKFKGIRNARDAGFWRSHTSREKMAKKFANYSFIILAVFLMTSPLSFYSIGLAGFNTCTLQELLRIVSTFILIGIEFESIMENIKSQFSEEEQLKIDAIYNRVKNGTTDLVELKIDGIINTITGSNKKAENKEIITENTTITISDNEKEGDE